MSSKSASVVIVFAALLTACQGRFPQDSQTPYNLALESAEEGDLDRAVEQLNDAIEKSGKVFFVDAHRTRGEYNYQRASFSQSSTTKGKLLAAANEDFVNVLAQEELGHTNRVRTLYYRGLALREAGDVESATRCFSNVVELSETEETAQERLGTHKALGEILLERALELREVEEFAGREELRSAQGHFSECLRIRPNDLECNRGKGICLYFRDMPNQATQLLESSTAQSDAAGVDNPIAYFYLARAVENHRGMQDQALTHYYTAFSQDRLHIYTPLYSHVVSVLRSYLPFQDPRFLDFFDQLLGYQGSDLDYWELVETTAEHLITDPTSEKKQFGNYARAVARARAGKIDEAVSDARELAKQLGNDQQERFRKKLKAIFPSKGSRLGYFYGRGKTLYSLKKFDEFNELFEAEISAVLDRSSNKDNYVHLLHALRGRNIVASWQEHYVRNPPNPIGVENVEESVEEGMDRQETLSEARDSFALCLELRPEEHDIRIALGEVEELLQAFTTAYLCYAYVAQGDPRSTPAFERILRLHSEGLLPPKKERVEAWATLRSYEGDSAEIRRYIRETAVKLRQQSERYCHICGRSGLDGEAACLECGGRLAGVSGALVGPHGTTTEPQFAPESRQESLR